MTLILVTGHWPLATHAAAAETSKEPPIVHLSGTPYEIGFQHGKLFRDEVRASVRQLLGYFRRYLTIPLVRTFMINWWLDRSWGKSKPHVPPDYLEELRGLSDGSGVPLRELYRFHAIPDRTYACSNFAAWGRRTSLGRLIHVRNLDWTIETNVQRFAVVFVVHPEGKRSFVNLGWAGFIGVLTGINDAQVSIGQVGAETADTSFRGEPMVFLMRRVMEEADTADDAARIISDAQRTVGVNYIVADADDRRALAIETTHRHVRVFEADDPVEHGVSYARPMVDVVFRADTAIDPVIREQQIASNGDPRRPGLEDPAGSSAYDVRYLGQAEGLEAHRGRLDAEAAREIAKSVAPSSNIQSVVFAWPEAWVANADGLTPAARTTYHLLNVEELLTR